MIHKKSIPLLVLMFVLVLSISAVSAADSDNSTIAVADESTEILDVNVDDGALEVDNSDDESLEADVDDALSYPSSSSDSWIKFDEDEITINEGDSYTIHGTLYSGNSKNTNGNFPLSYNCPTQSGYHWVDLRNGQFSLDITSWNLPASATKYKITFVPEDGYEYWEEFAGSNPEMVDSYVNIKVNSPSAPSTGVVHATVTSDNVGVPNAKVVLTGSETYTGTANRQGVCDIEDVLYGDYTVTVTANGYEELTDTVTVDGDEINLPLALTKLDPLCGEDDSGIYLTEEGVVSGDAKIFSVNPWQTSGSLQVTLPADVKDVKSAVVIINSYSGSGSSETYALHSDVTLTTDSTTTLGSEDLYYYGVQTNDPNVYIINDHTTKQYSDYQYVYDITDTVAALNAGSSLTINVTNSRYGSYGFDARIKMITLFLAYDDEDKDKLTYWFGIGQSWTQGERHEIIPTASYDFESYNITLETIALSSYYAQEYMVNGELLNDPIEVLKGPYYIHAYWDTDECYIGDFFPSGQDMDFSFGASQEGWGSYKTNLILFKEFEEEKFGDVYLSVTDDEGPVENAVVVLSDGERTYTGVIDDLGLGEINNVPYGEYNVTVTADGYEDYTGTITVNDFANDLDVTLTALPTHSTVHVSVVCNNIEPIANANVVLSGDNTYTATTDDEGVCDIQNVQYGDYTVTVTASGYKTLTSTVTVDSEEMDLPLAIKENIPTTVNKMYLFDTGVVSGEAKIISVNPWTTSGSLSYVLPENLTNVKSAIVVINSYSGSGDSNTYGLHSDVTLTTDSTTTIGSEDLVYTGNQASDDTVYTINGHTTKQYSDYQYHYNITNAVAALNAGDSLTISVSNSKIAGRNGFDGRIKMITLFLAYDDGDNDNITYWLDVGQHWTAADGYDDITTRSYNGPKDNLTLQNIALSSAQATNFKLNNNAIGNPTTIQSGSFYINAYWTSENNGLSDYFRQGSNTRFAYTNNGGSYKNVLVLLTATEKEVVLPNIVVNQLSTPWSEGVFAGVDNNLTVKINNQEAGAVENVVVEVVSSEGNTVIATETIDSLASGVTTLVINDPTIRDITEQTVSGQYNNNLVTYTVNVKYGDVVLDSKSYNKKIAYDGYLNKTYAYGGHDNQVNRVYTIDGDIIIASQDISKYADQFTRSRTETWDITLPEGAELVKAFLYFNYNWDTSYFPDGWTLTFDDADITNDYIALEKDQGNLGYYGAYGYGLAVFDVTDYFVDGENTFVIEKTGNCALYPSTLMVLYDQPGSTQIKDVYFTDICDVLYGYYNTEYAGKTNVFVPYEDINLTDMTDASWYVFAGSASGSTDGNLLFNGKEFNSIWSSYSSDNTCFAYLANVTDVISEDNDAWYLTNPKAMTTVVVYEQVLVVTKAKQVPGAEIAMNSEYTSVPSVYAGVENRLTVKVTNNGNVDGENVLVNVFIGDELVGSETIADYVVGETYTLNFVDSTIRPVTENTIVGNNNDNVVYTVVVEDANGPINSDDFSFVIVYNGNLGKDYAYPGLDQTVREYTFVGDVIVVNGNTYSTAAKTNRTDDFAVDLGDGSVKEALLYVSYNWDNVATGDFNSWNTTFNGQTIAPIASYRDQGNLGRYGTRAYGLVVYNVTGLVVDGDNSFVLEKSAGGVAVYPSSLIVLVDNPATSIENTVYIIEEADMLSATYNKNLEASYSTAFSTVDGDATLYVFAAGAAAGEGDLVINGETVSNVWSGTSETFDTYSTSVDAGEFTVDFVATGSTILALHQMVVVQNALPGAETTLTSEYTSVPSVYAGVVNNLTVKVKNTGAADASDVVVKVYLGDELIGSETIADYAVGETYTLNIVDSTIRPVTENTVVGNNNENAVYTVVVEDANGEISSDDFSFVIVYNGNLGKDYAYPGLDQTVREYTFVGDVIVVNGNTYSTAAKTNRTDDFAVELGDGSVKEALLYVSYNWDNVATGDFNSWNTTFNGQTIAPIASYRDQGNLGRYGTRAYGLVVYNVTDFVVDGDNSFVLEKSAGGVAVYPSSLIVLVDNPNSAFDNTVYIIEEADMLSHTNNKNLEASYSTAFSTVDGDATLYVFAAGAAAGEGDLVINGETVSNVWSGTSESFDTYSTSVDAGDVAVKFVATGSTILALHQMVVVQNDRQSTIEVDELVMDYKDGSTLEIKLVDTKGNAIPGARILVNNTLNIYKYDTDDQGIVNVPVNLKPGEYTFGISFAGNAICQGSNATASVVVNKLMTTISVSDVEATYKGNDNYVVTVTDANGNPVSGITVNVNNGDKDLRYRTDSDGVANVPVTLKPGNYTFEVSFAGNALYAASNSSSDVIVNKGEVNIDASDLVVTYNDGTPFEATLTDANGDAISGVTVKFDFGPKYKRYHTDANGVATAPLDLKPGEYNCTISFAGNSLYAAANITKTLTINKAAATLEASNVNMSYKDGNLTATLKDADGNAISGATVSFTQGTSTYRYHTDANGVATAPINLKPGEYNYTISFAGNALNGPVNTTAVVKVNKIDVVLNAEDISMTFKDGTNYTAKLTDINGNPIVGVIVKLNRTGSTSTYKYKTDSEGMISVPLNFKVGTYDFLAFIEDSDIYNPASVATTVTITK